MVIPIVIGALDIATKGLIQGLVGQRETIRTTASLRLARILRRILETWCHSNSSEKTSPNASVKTLKGWKKKKIK